jgi:Mor family transcriptional regulator
MTGNYDGRTVVADMIEGCAAVVDRAAAVKGVRELCRYFGGQLVYVPAGKRDSDVVKELCGVLRDAVGEEDGLKMAGKITAMFGGSQIYVPMEKMAFRQIIAREIYERYDGAGGKLRDLCREYGVSFTTVYRLFHKGRDDPKQREFEFTEE